MMSVRAQAPTSTESLVGSVGARSVVSILGLVVGLLSLLILIGR